MTKLPIVTVIVVSVYASSSASADKKGSAAAFKEGKAAYQSGRYDKAAEHFEQAYEEFAAPAYLYNLGQAYRKLGDCPKARDNYRGFLEAKPESAQVSRVREILTELDAQCPLEDSHEPEVIDLVGPVRENAARQPVEVADSVEGAETEAGVHKAVPSKPQGTPAITRDEARSSLALRATAGAAIHSLGEVSTPITPSGELAVEYQRTVGLFVVGVGARLSATSMEYLATESTESLSFFRYGLVISGGYPVTNKIVFGLEAGAGMLHLGSLVSGNPLTASGMATEATSGLEYIAGTFVQLGLSSEWRARVGARFQSAVSPDSWASDISEASSVELSGGASYHF